jgi:hypothetical protein
LRLPHFLDSLLTDGGEVVSLMRQVPLYSQENFIVQLEGLGQLKDAVTSLGIEPVTFQLAV